MALPTSDPVITDSAQLPTVAASQNAAALSGGGGGAIGDYLAGLIIVPETTSPGAVTFQDGSGSAVTAFPGGASSVADLKPFPVLLGGSSTAGPWKVTTGANVHIIARGRFT